MMNVKREASEFGLKFIAENPRYAADVNELYKLMITEIEEGGSPDEELESFKQSVEQLLED